MENTRIVRFGLGQVVSNWGTYEGKPAVFIEPVLGEPGVCGDDLLGDREPQILGKTEVGPLSDGAIVLVLDGDIRGAEVLLEDIHSAMRFAVGAKPISRAVPGTEDTREENT